MYVCAGRLHNRRTDPAQHLDIRSCVCSSNKSSCYCKDAEKSVQVLPDAVSKCIAARTWQSSEDTPYPKGSCGVAQRYADIACIVSRDKPFPGHWCGGAQQRADLECAPSKRRAEDANEPLPTDACTAAQHRASGCIVSRIKADDVFPGHWCGGSIGDVDKHCGVPIEKRTDGFPGDWCGRRKCVSARDKPLPGNWCGRSLRLARDCLVSRSTENNFSDEWCGGAQKRADHCIVSRGWTGYPWDVCASTDAECIAAAKRELGYEMEVKRDSEADACGYASRRGRRAVTPPHCMCAVERDEAGVDAVKRCRCGEETKEASATQYHCMCLTGEGDATVPCSCNSDVAFLSEVQYEQ